MVGPFRAAVAELPHHRHAHPHQAPASVCQHQEWTNAGPHPQAQIPEAAQPSAGETLRKLCSCWSADYPSPCHLLYSYCDWLTCFSKCRDCAKTLMWLILCASQFDCSKSEFCHCDQTQLLRAMLWMLSVKHITDCCVLASQRSKGLATHHISFSTTLMVNAHHLQVQTR